MRVSKHTDLRDGSSCELEFNEEEGWLRAIWLGHVDPMEAYNGAEMFLSTMQNLHCPYLLNDNSRLSGPWFDSVEWLRSVWMPRALHLGLRYIAHVVQPHDLLDQAATLGDCSPNDELRLQLFDDVPTAEEWLRSVRIRQEA
ncbi:hypothetical protein HMJ29_03715 [Hymenobacter taeanensis]|uniref:STAS/SEC14 domain-containing protein n=1 Tax=Hymenobacter taeanensis TaxID=2735321 RepID=A0A6M6BED7_9BACT|nr:MULTISPECIES: hypothetical protein [Hymenobacter]QJX46094.1 hypothetical protein HMJ29_03715 [Hymenobacter taeanensis]UOQ79948.1 hypothetical protein MUN83_13970 [Hymenobacter sp. 5414T-23]